MAVIPAGLRDPQAEELAFRLLMRRDPYARRVEVTPRGIGTMPPLCVPTPDQVWVAIAKALSL